MLFPSRSDEHLTAIHLQDIKENPPTPPLFRIPRELRDHIYRHILVSKSDKGIHARMTIKEPNFLSTCRQIRNEGLPVYYGDNIFRGSEALTMLLKANVPTVHSYGPPEYLIKASALRQWLLLLGPKRAKMIKHMRIAYNHDVAIWHYRFSPIDGSLDIRRYYISWRGLRSWAEAGGEADGARVAARLMLEGLREDGLLRLSSVEPVLSFRAESEERKFQAGWTKAMNELKVSMSNDPVEVPGDQDIVLPPLLRISGELRNHIYRYALVSKTDKALYGGRPPKEPALLAVSRQIRTEACSIFYGENIFKVTEAVTREVYHISVFGPCLYKTETSALRQWLQLLGPERTAMIKHLRLMYDRSCDHPASSTKELRARSQYQNWRGLKDCPDAGPRGARGAARAMLMGLGEDGLLLSSVEPVMLRKSDRAEQDFQRLWVEAVEELKMTLAANTDA